MPLSNYMQDRLGSATINLSEPVVAGSYACFELVYTAGYFGIDDSGCLKVVQRTVSDMAAPQFTEPGQPNYVSVEADNGTGLQVRYDSKDNFRPWGKAITVKLVKGFLREGDRVKIRFGDPEGGGPGMRMQTFCEDTFELRVLVDAFATRDYVELTHSPTLTIVPGKPARWKVVLPTLRRRGEAFRLGLKAEDIWGNPTHTTGTRLRLESSLAVSGLPQEFDMPDSGLSAIIDGLSAGRCGDLVIKVYDHSDILLARSNPLRVVDSSDRLHYWGDLHGQSEETVGSNTIDQFFSFARDTAFLDVAGHQGNDFQVTPPFWEKIQQTTRRFYEPGRFVTFPGYEWSGNTGMGGDHNVIFKNEGQTIHRSSHALIEDLSDEHTDRHTTRELLDALKSREVFFYAHVGGRYADLNLSKEFVEGRAIEIHSDWGTFEWLLHDAFRLNMTVGIVANSDGHKGRPGSSYPGAATFGSYGGLTCFLCPELTRDAVFESLAERHHYATTGTRALLEVRLRCADGSDAIMGDRAENAGAEARLRITALCASPIERLDVLDGPTLVRSVRPWALPVRPEADASETYESAANRPGASRRIRVVWEGAEYRGRGRETVWDGTAEIEGNTLQSYRPINFWNPESTLSSPAQNHLSWSSITTGGFSGFEIVLAHAKQGLIRLHTPLVREELSIAGIGENDTVYDAGGLDRRVRVYRLPDDNPHRQVDVTMTVPLAGAGVHPLYARLTLEDGHRVWSSPIYARVKG